MVKDKLLNFRDDDLYENMAAEAKQRGISENELILQYIAHGLKCKSEATNTEMKLTVLSAPQKCLKCGRDIPRGEWALYGGGVNAICIDCYVERIGDKAIMARFLKMRQLEQIIKAFKIEADRLAEKVDLGQTQEKIDDMHKKFDELYKLNMDYLKTGIVTDTEHQKLEDVNRACQDLMKEIAACQEYLYQKLHTPLKRPRGTIT